MKSKKAVKCVRWCWKSFCIVFFCKKNVKRDLIILIGLIVLLGALWTATQRQHKKELESELTLPAIEEKQPTEEESVLLEEKEISEIQSRFDISSWTPYQNSWFGFSLKYPKDWLDPVAKKAPIGALWEQKIQFRLSQTSEENPFEGFDVIIYPISKVKELFGTDEFPKLKNEELRSVSECAVIEGHLLETGDYPAEEIYVPSNDACYNAALFFTNTRGDYIYNIAPKIKDGSGLAGDPAREVASHIPEFFAVVSDWELIDIQRPKPVPPKPRITAPMPASYKIVDGRLVCAKKNDNPGKSKQNKGRHMDMECCLDPDEYPNPHCYYPPNKYGKYL
jgi:hypothetical protein